MWGKLSIPWQAAVEQAWQAYCAGTIPIGAVIVDSDGQVVARSRNRIFDKSAPPKQIHNDMLAHAEINALLALELNQAQRHSAAIFTTMEPCPLCMGAIYMSSVRTIHYAARDPYAGSTNLIGTTPYLSRKSLQVFGPTESILEHLLIAMLIETEIWSREEKIIDGHFFDEWRAMRPEAVELGIRLFRSGELRTKITLSVETVIDWLAQQI